MMGSEGKMGFVRSLFTRSACGSMANRPGDVAAVAGLIALDFPELFLHLRCRKRF